MMSAIIYSSVSFLKKLISSQMSDYKVLMPYGGGKYKRMRNSFAALVVFFVSELSVAASPVTDSLQFRILFPVNSSTVQTELFDNAAVLSEFLDAYNKLGQNESSSVTGLTVYGNASVEGNYENNKLLAQKRALAVYQYLRSEHSIPDSTIKDLFVIPSEFTAEYILSSFPETLPGIDLPAIRKISSSTDGLHLKQAFRRLDGGDDGVNWNWYKENILAPSRYVQINLYYCRIAEDAPSVQEAEEEESQVTMQEPEPPVVPEPAAIVAMPQPEPQQQPERIKSELRLGTNLLYDVATVANLYFEAEFAPHMAANLSATFSPWDIKRPDIKIRTLIFQPEFRWYFADNFKGHYVGIEGHFGWYNVALGGKTRYQDRDGNTPLWGAGLSYGYVLPFNEHWGMDFGISAGYARLVYDCFYNVENGAKFTTSTRNWWGPTKVGISIYYQF